MTEVTIKIPEDIKDIVGAIDEPIYVEALRKVAREKLLQKQKRLKELQRKMAVYETKYGKDYAGFSQNIPDTLKGHNDWIEWAYLYETAVELSAKIEKLKLLLGK